MLAGLGTSYKRHCESRAQGLADAVYVRVIELFVN